MEVMQIISEFGGWSWVVAGLVLLAIELAAPGGVFVWLGISGLVTGALVLLFGAEGLLASWAMQWAIFGVLSLVGIFGWLRVKQARGGGTSDELVNRGGARYIGHEVELDEPIADGYGRIALGDGIWRVRGPDMPAGRRVRVVASDGAVLSVEPANESER